MGTLYLASDHAGFKLKEEIKKALTAAGVRVEDLGCHSEESVDYPDYAHNLAKKIAATPESEGVLICGSGIGMAIAANRHPEVRAALVTSREMATLAKTHNNANVLVLGSRLTDGKDARAFVEAWRGAKFEGGRHQRRVDKL